MTVSPEQSTPNGPRGSPATAGPSTEDSPVSSFSDPDAVGGGRPTLLEAELTRERGSRLRVRVVLLRGERRVEEELQGVGDEVIELRLAAEATITALDRLIDRPGFFELVGIKQLHAFDAQVVLVCVRTGPGFPTKLIGCVPAPRTLVRGVAMAVLHATNRLVEAMGDPDAESDSEAPEQEIESTD